jgi:hypothetical protein
MEFSNVQILTLIGCIVQLITRQITFMKLNVRYGIGITKRFPGEIVTYLIFTVPGKQISSGTVPSAL